MTPVLTARAIVHLAGPVDLVSLYLAQIWEGGGEEVEERSLVGKGGEVAGGGE
jgi:hypothetical protein